MARQPAPKRGGGRGGGGSGGGGRGGAPKRAGRSGSPAGGGPPKRSGQSAGRSSSGRSAGRSSGGGAPSTRRHPSAGRGGSPAFRPTRAVAGGHQDRASRRRARRGPGRRAGRGPPGRARAAPDRAAQGTGGAGWPPTSTRRRCSRTSWTSRPRTGSCCRRSVAGKLESAARTEAPQGVLAFAAPLPEARSRRAGAAPPGTAGALPALLRRHHRPRQPRRAPPIGRVRRRDRGPPAPAPGRPHHAVRDQGGGRRGRAPPDGRRRRAADGLAEAQGRGGVGARPRRRRRSIALGGRGGRRAGGARARGGGRRPQPLDPRAAATSWCRSRCGAACRRLNVGTAGALACYEVARHRAR